MFHPRPRFKLQTLVLAITAAALLLAQFKTWLYPDPPTATILRPTFHFGTMIQHAKGRHAFTFQNDGSTPLRLNLCQTTTHMSGVYTLVNGKKSSLWNQAVTIVPGGSTKIFMEWETRECEGSFSKGTLLLTNDPTKPDIRLTVEGTITK
jgi:HYDIN/CFA65/VesB family protein